MLPIPEHGPLDDNDVRRVPSDAADANVSTPVISNDLPLAEAASVSEAVVGAGFSLSASDGSHQTDLDNTSPSGALFCDPEVVVIGEGDASPPVRSHVVLDDRFNELDELASQQSQSVLPNCRPSAVSSGGESANSNQISNSNGLSQTILSNCCGVIRG